MRAAVSGKELKSAFIDMAALFKGYERAKAVGVETTKDSITFTVDTGISYTRTIALSGVTDGINMSITVLFADLAHFISARETVFVDITQFYVAFTSGTTVLTLQIGDSIIAPYTPRGGKMIDLDFGKIRSAIKLLTSTQDLQKAFMRDFAINFYGDYALLKTPTVWVRTKSQGLYCTLSGAQAKSIIAYQPEFVQESDRLEFHKGNAILSIPRITPTETDRFPELRNTLQFTCVLQIDNAVKELQEIKRAIGVAEADIHLHKEGFNIRINKGGVQLEQNYGAVGESVYSFRYMLDIFIMCLNLLSTESQIIVSTRGDLICLENQDTSILMRV